MLQKIREEEAVNVYKFVKELRKDRCQMVQTEVYKYIYDLTTCNQQNKHVCMHTS